MQEKENKEIPNSRTVDCCGTCKNGSDNYDIVDCILYSEMMLYIEICDDFESRKVV